MKQYVYTPRRWDKEARALWQAGQREEAATRCLASLETETNPDADAFIQPAFYLFQLDRFAQSAAVMEKAVKLFPDHPMIRLTLGSSYTRARQHSRAIPHLERFVSFGYADMSAFDALAHSLSETDDFIRARLFGTLALQAKDKATASRHGQPELDLYIDPAGKPRVIAFTLFGSHPRYLRGALQNVLSQRSLYPGWKCRFYVDDSVDETFLTVMAEEGAEIVMDDGGNRDLRHLLTRRFIVSDDPEVGYFIVRDCDSVISPREAAAVTEWLDSGLPFHTMRDWFTHTDPMLAGMWGGIAGVFPDMAGAIARFTEQKELSTNWDQFFLREEVWPAIRDHCLVHDRCFNSHRAQPFPTETPPGREHVGQNEYASTFAEQGAALMKYADRIPALGIGAKPTEIVFKPVLRFDGPTASPD